MLHFTCNSTISRLHTVGYGQRLLCADPKRNQWQFHLVFTESDNNMALDHINRCSYHITLLVIEDWTTFLQK